MLNFISFFVFSAINFHDIILAELSDGSTTPETGIDWAFVRESNNCRDGYCGQMSMDNEDSVDPTLNLRRFIYSIPNEEEKDRNDQRKYVYLNYKKAYGIRYDPSSVNKPSVSDNSKKARKCNQTYQTILPTGIFDTDLTTPMPTTTTTTTTDLSSVPQTTAISASETSTNIIDDGVTTTARPIRHRQSTKKNIYMNNGQPYAHMPSSPQRGFFRNVLDYIGDKFKRLFNYGLQISLPLPAQHGGPRFLNLFNVIKFENTPCTSSETMLSEMSGTCYHDDECRDMGGIPIDKCADGFGVCCACK